MEFSKVVRPLIPIFLSIFVANPSWAEECETIRFKRGESSATIDGIAPQNHPTCYQMTTGQGQKATMRVTAGRNICFSIADLIDCQDD
jgi:hypothetical protein